MRSLALLAILIVPLCAARDVDAPLPPVDVSASSTSGGVLVSWSPPVYDGGSAVTGYTVQSSASGLSWTVVGATDGQTFALVVPDGPLLFRVLAVNDHGPGLESAPASADAFCSPAGVGLDPPGYTINWDCFQHHAVMLRS
jgi:titin